MGKDAIPQPSAPRKSSKYCTWPSPALWSLGLAVFGRSSREEVWSSPHAPPWLQLGALEQPVRWGRLWLAIGVQQECFCKDERSPCSHGYAPSWTLLVVFTGVRERQAD